MASRVAPFHLNSATKRAPTFLSRDHVVAAIPMGSKDVPKAPSLSWRAASITTIAFTGFLAKAFARVACTTEVHGLDGFVKLLDERENVDGRKQGLITGESAINRINSGRYV